jgi:prepilin-type N-terminal cleavage/methylation domain-containing protein
MSLTSTGLRHGFALVEALVALVLLSVALAGSAVLLVQAVRHERAASERSRALRHVASLSDVLRALQRADGEPLQALAAPGSTPDCSGSPLDCAAESEAAQMVADWQVATEDDMPSGAIASVTWLETPPASYSVSVSWPGPGAGPGSAVQLLVDP